MTLLFTLITAQVVLGAIDNFWHHEITERLPAKRAAAGELSLHAARELLYALLFFALAWFEWRGAWAWLIGAVLVVEILITLADFIVEDRTRKLPPTERILHTILAISIGLVMAAITPILLGWWSQPTEIVLVHYGPVAWVFTLFALGAFAWSVRNTIAVLHHRGPAKWVRDPIAPGVAETPRTVLISGATGFIGGHVVRRLIERGDGVIVLTRDADRALYRFGPHARIVTSLDSIQSSARIDAIVNLAGAPIIGLPWTRGRRQKLIASRIGTTRALVELCARLYRPPKVFVSGSAIGYYGVHGDELLTERDKPQTIFQSQLCREWEEAANAAESIGARVVKLRFGLVLGRDGGALPQFALPVRLGLGAILGSGKQWVSWIHIDDVVRLVEFAIDTPLLHGAVNAVAPKAATHRQLQRSLARTLYRPLWFRVPAFMLRALLGEMAQLFVDGQRVLPAKALAAGFTFRHRHLGEALSDLTNPAEACTAEAPADMYYNGECPVCQAEMSRYAQHCAATSTKVRFIDSTQQAQPLAEYGLRSEHLERRVYLRDASGRMLSGLPALIELWRRMPGFSLLAKLLSIPGVHRVSVMIYDHIVAPALAHWARARRRHETA